LISQTDLQTALNAKQATLVSGTNIKTVNSTSLLGSGDIAVQPTLVSGTNIKTVNGNSLLGSGDVTISGGGNVGVHAIMPLASGQSCGALLNSFSLTTTATIVNRLYAYPFIPNQNITTSGMYINVTTAVASALSRILIYSNVNGLPNTKLYESANLDCSTTGVKTATTTFNFVAGTTYWLAFYSNSTSTINFINTTNLLPININTTNINVYAWSGATFGSAPTTFNPSPNFSTTVAPYIGITKA
jgi:hypothetical protein